MPLKWEDLKVGMIIKKFDRNDDRYIREIKYVGSNILVTQRSDGDQPEFSWNKSFFSEYDWTEVKPTVKKWIFLYQVKDRGPWYNCVWNSEDKAIFDRGAYQRVGHKVSEIKEVEFEV